MLTRILVAYDGGNIAMRALDKAIELAKDTAAEIYLISIYTDNDIQAWRLRCSHYPANAGELFSPNSRDFSAAEAAYVNSLQAEPADKVCQAGIPLHCRITKGKPDTAIVEYAKEVCADLVVTGTHNHGTAAKLLLGSVANSIIRNAPCPVMVVRGD
ncbi:MAG TPA: universal stress protein [Syntrophomonadaceae bacterium]|nr:universal stress protein [Syntrophomonadaceae bacterium]